METQGMRGWMIVCAFCALTLPATAAKEACPPDKGLLNDYAASIFILEGEKYCPEAKVDYEARRARLNSYLSAAAECGGLWRQMAEGIAQKTRKNLAEFISSKGVKPFCDGLSDLIKKFP